MMQFYQIYHHIQRSVHNMFGILEFGACGIKSHDIVKGFMGSWPYYYMMKSCSHVCLKDSITLTLGQLLKEDSLTTCTKLNVDLFCSRVDNFLLFKLHNIHQRKIHSSHSDESKSQT